MRTINYIPPIKKETNEINESLSIEQSINKVFEKKKEEDENFHLSHTITEPKGELIKVELVRSVDGDTAIFEINGKKEPVRFIGVDAPESVDPDEDANIPQGDIASEFTNKILQENKDNIYLEYDIERTGPYDRLLAYVWIGDKMLNEILLEEGYAEAKTYMPNDKYAEDFKKIENYAKSKKEGFWGQNIFEDDELPQGVERETTPEEINLGLYENISEKFTMSQGYNELNTSFSGVDTKMTVTFEGGAPVTIGEVQTVTYSLFRPIEPVYSLGDARPTGFVRGQRTIAGSIIFTVFDRNVLLNAFHNAYAKHADKECVNQEYLTDELPPFDMHITFMNEYGVSAALVVYGCYIPTEGQVHSIEDMITENTMQYVAQDISLMKPGAIT